MLIIKSTAESNGARANQTIDSLPVIPDGWLEVPTALEDTALNLLPFILITQDDSGNITALDDDTDARAAWEEEQAAIIPEPTDFERLQAQIDYLAIMTEVGIYV
jgi:hypothetical protein